MTAGANFEASRAPLMAPNLTRGTSLLDSPILPPARHAERPRAGLFSLTAPPLMPVEPAVKRALTFIDGQNLFHSARLAFGYTYPNYDVRALADRLCRMQGWQSSEVRFYTGIPASSDDSRWYHFWSAKLAMMGRQGIHVYSRPLRYRTKTVRLSNGEMFTFVAGEEKGVDVRIALDIIRFAHRAE